MNGPKRYCVSVVSQSEKTSTIQFHLHGMCNLKTKTNQQNRNSNIFREQIDGCQIGGGVTKKDEGIEYKLPVIKNSHREVNIGIFTFFIFFIF